MNEAELRAWVAVLTILFLVWIGGYAYFSSRRFKMQAIAVSPRQTTPWQKVLLAMAVLLDSYLVVRAIIPSIDQMVMVQASPAPLFALAVMIAGFLLVIATHLHMSASWRIGVPDEGNDIEVLITTGTHKFSRNPIYLGILVMLGGIVLAAPGPITVAGLLLTFFGLQSIIAEEERYLQRRFGIDYRVYQERVRRWV